MHVPPAWRRWAKRGSLAIAVAFAVAFLPWMVASDGDRVERLRDQLRRIKREAAELERVNARHARQIRALRSDPQAIEDHARDELGMVYPGELVLRIERRAEASE